MEIITTVSTAYSAAKGIMDIGKGLLSAKIDAEVKDRFRELLDKVGTFQEGLFYLREELLKLQNEKVALKSQIDELQSKLSMKDKMVYEPPFFWLVEGNKRDGPFCQRCWEADEKAIHLIEEKGRGRHDYWDCEACNKEYEGPNYSSNYQSY